MGTATTLSYDADVQFGERVREARQAAGLSIAEAGRRAGISRSSWHDLESGHRGNNPTLSTVAAVAQALGLSMLELLEGVDVEIDT